MGKCPYCDKDLCLEDFFEFEVKESKKGKIKKQLTGLKGDFISLGARHGAKMWVCPACDKILGFSEYDSNL